MKFSPFIGLFISCNVYTIKRLQGIVECYILIPELQYAFYGTLRWYEVDTATAHKQLLIYNRKKSSKVERWFIQCIVVCHCPKPKNIPTIIETPEARRGTIFSEKRYEENPALDSSFVGNFIQKKWINKPHNCIEVEIVRAVLKKFYFLPT